MEKYSDMDRKEIDILVKDFLTEELEIDEDKVFPSSRLKEDMGIDSLEIVDVVAFVDECFGFKMDVADFRQLTTLDAFCGHIAEKTGR